MTFSILTYRIESYQIWPMFFYWVGSQRQFCEENQAKMAILSYFDIFVQVSNLSHILPSEYYETKSSGNCLCLYQGAYNINLQGGLGKVKAKEIPVSMVTCWTSILDQLGHKFWVQFHQFQNFQNYSWTNPTQSLVGRTQSGVENQFLLYQDLIKL